MNLKPWMVAILAQKASQNEEHAIGDESSSGSGSNDGCTGLLALFALLALDAVLFVVAWFAWMVYWPVAIVFTLPFAALTLILIVQLIRPRQA